MPELFAEATQICFVDMPFGKKTDPQKEAERLTPLVSFAVARRGGSASDDYWDLAMIRRDYELTEGVVAKVLDGQNDRRQPGYSTAAEKRERGHRRTRENHCFVAPDSSRATRLVDSQGTVPRVGKRHVKVNVQDHPYPYVYRRLVCFF